jgi:uncharacterized membrane protein
MAPIASLATVGGLASKLGRGRQAETPSGTGRGRRLPVEEAVDVGVDIETAYDQFTQFEEWPRFMHRLKASLELRGDATGPWGGSIENGDVVDEQDGQERHEAGNGRRVPGG